MCWLALLARATRAATVHELTCVVAQWAIGSLMKLACRRSELASPYHCQHSSAHKETSSEHCAFPEAEQHRTALVANYSALGWAHVISGVALESVSDTMSIRRSCLRSTLLAVVNQLSDVG